VLRSGVVLGGVPRVLDSRRSGHQLLLSEEAIMNFSEIVMLALFLTIFVVVPIVFAQIGSRRQATIKPSFRECPRCGAHNYKTKERCYCCGFGFVLPQSDGPDPALIQRVKQADDSRMRRKVETQIPQAVEDEPERAEKASEL
jgi:hypothetical protein